MLCVWDKLVQLGTPRRSGWTIFIIDEEDFL